MPNKLNEDRKVFGIMRIAKRKQGNITGLEFENNRSADKPKNFDNSDINWEKTPENVYLKNSKGKEFKTQNWETEALRTIEENNLKIRKVKSEGEGREGKTNRPKNKNASVLLIDALYTATEDFFLVEGEEKKTRKQRRAGEEPKIDKERAIKYFQDCLNFHIKHFCQGKEERVLNAVIHFDETTPHMHIVSLPIYEDAQHKKHLSAKTILGNGKRQFMQELQQRFFEEVCENRGLERGEQKDFLERKLHRTVAELKEITLNEEKEELEKEKELLEKSNAEAISKRRSELSQLENESRSRKKKLEEITDETKSLLDEQESIKTNIDNLTALKNSLEQEIEKEREEIRKKLQKAIQKEIEREIEEKKQELKQIEGEINQLDSKVKVKKTIISDKEQEIEDKNQELEKKNQEFESISSQITNLQEQLKAIQEEKGKIKEYEKLTANNFGYKEIKWKWNKKSSIGINRIQKKDKNGNSFMVKEDEEIVISEADFKLLHKKAQAIEKLAIIAEIEAVKENKDLKKLITRLEEQRRELEKQIKAKNQEIETKQEEINNQNLFINNLIDKLNSLEELENLEKLFPKEIITLKVLAKKTEMEQFFISDEQFAELERSLEYAPYSLDVNYFCNMDNKTYSNMTLFDFFTDYINECKKLNLNQNEKMQNYINKLNHISDLYNIKQENLTVQQEQEEKLLPNLSSYSNHLEKVGQKMFEALGGNEEKYKEPDLTNLPKVIKEAKAQGFGIDENALYTMQDEIKRGKKYTVLAMAEVFSNAVLSKSKNDVKTQDYVNVKTQDYVK